MKKLIIIAMIVLSLFIASCTSNQKPTVCSEEARLCADGSVVVKTLPTCEFAPCPNSTSKCDYTIDTKKYVGKSLDECQRIKFVCEINSEYFSDECGCGCIKNDAKNYCDQNKRPDMCTLEYMPVCGWFSENIKCIKYPCASTFGNKCQACSAANVAYWTKGECPK